MVIQSFLNSKWGEFRGCLPISFNAYGMLYKILRWIWDTWDPTSRVSLLQRQIVLKHAGFLSTDSTQEDPSKQY